MREIRWDCNVKGCYRKLMPRLEAFDDCFPGSIGMSDVDGIVEYRGRFLLLEWKAPGGTLTRGQSIMFEQMTAASPMFTVVVVAGEPQDMTVDTVQVFQGGKSKPPEKCTFDSLRARIFAWAKRAERSAARPSRRAAWPTPTP